MRKTANSWAVELLRLRHIIIGITKRFNAHHLMIEQKIQLEHEEDNLITHKNKENKEKMSKEMRWDEMILAWRRF